MGDNEKQQHKVKGVVDICFLIDATGSMQPCIDDIKGNIKNFITMLTTPDANGGVMINDWRACVCGYRDFKYDPKYGKDAMVMNKFTRDPSELESQLNALKAEGGGDEPESLLDALYTVVSRGKTEKAPPWRTTSGGMPQMRLGASSSSPMRRSILTWRQSLEGPSTTSSSFFSRNASVFHSSRRT